MRESGHWSANLIKWTYCGYHQLDHDLQNCLFFISTLEAHLEISAALRLSVRLSPSQDHLCFLFQYRFYHVLNCKYIHSTLVFRLLYLRTKVGDPRRDYKLYINVFKSMWWISKDFIPNIFISLKFFQMWLGPKQVLISILHDE